MESVVAYLDPGTGSVILQALLGGLAGAAVALKLFGRRILSFLRIRRPKRNDPPEPASEPDAG